MKKILYSLFLLVCALPLSGNNAQVTNISMENQHVANRYVHIEFDISWENSWRTTSIPNNWDACWIFAKYNVGGGEWKHATISNTGITVPYGSTIDVADDSLGAFIYRSSDGNGTVNWFDARLRWLYGIDGVADDASVEVKVFAIEMVYIPEGSFYVGDGQSYEHLHEGSDTTMPYQILSEAKIDLGATAGKLWSTGSIWHTPDSIIEAYPKGYNDIYCMKYEISAEQYVGFLNTLDRTQQNTRTETDISGTNVTNCFVLADENFPYPCYGISIRCDTILPATGPIVMYCDANNNATAGDVDDGQNIPVGFLWWTDLAAYLDWSGLRPMSELEYEKICRGPNTPVAGEFAWGTANYHTTPSYTVINSKQANETITDMGVNTGNFSCDHNSCILRCGIFAASSINHTRVESGATYYGVMEMSGNREEQVVTIEFRSSRTYKGHHGNGFLDVAGNADVDYWPGINGNSSIGSISSPYQGITGVTKSNGVMRKGGYYDEIISRAKVSNRKYAKFSPNSRIHPYGGRGVRTAP